jgi:light-regulated signal transduction histidine kinase (bacteriophytochrome)
MVGTNTDITKQKEIEKELRNANAYLEQFAYSASHDLQEPLRTVIIFSELLARHSGERLDGKALEFLKSVMAGASRMEALLRDLLAYIRRRCVLKFLPKPSMDKQPSTGRYPTSKQILRKAARPSIPIRYQPCGSMERIYSSFFKTSSAMPLNTAGQA